VSAALSMLEVVDQVGQERHANRRLYQMAVGALAALAERDSPMVAPAFFLKVLALEGSAPMLDGCVSCGEDDDAQLVAFDIVEGASCAGRAVGAGRCRPTGSPSCAGPWAAGCPCARRAPLARHRRGGGAGHRGHGGPPGPPPPVRPGRPGLLTLRRTP